MNAIVRIALSRPYTFIVMAVLITIFGALAALRTPTDIFPEIKVPVIGVAFNFAGLSAGDMSNRIVTQFERFLTTTVNDVEHTESQSISGIGIVKVYFQPGTDIRTATAQVVSVGQTSTKQMPAGITPPLILNYSASTVPILQLAASDKTLSEQQLFDQTQVVVRPVITTVKGAATPFPYGGQQRQIQVDLDPQALQSKGLSATDVTNAIAAQNQILPVGFVKIGSYQYNVRLNDAADSLEELNNLPIRTAGGATIYVHDVGQVRDGAPPQTNIVHVDGARAVLSTILKNGSASTLAIVQGVKDKLPGLKENLPPTFKITPLNDQSLFVKGAISSVVKEGAIAAALTSLMILLFLGSWRSTVIIAVSIPLAVLAAIAALSATGQTLNIMTLGGLALAVGILVDDATVTIENINWHLEQGKDVRTAILDGANQIVTPAFVSLLCICIVFVPMFLLKGVAGFLFVPMAMAVVFAMIASFVLSRTLVPTLAMYLLKPHAAEAHHGADVSRNPVARFQRRFETGFARVRDGYAQLLERAMGARRPFLIGFMAVVLLSFGLAPFLGSNFFPSVDAGQLTLHVRAPVGTRLEDTSLEFGRIAETIRRTIPADEISSVVDNIGIPNSSINMVYSNSGVIGPEDGDIYVTLKPRHHSTAGYMKRLREILPRDYPGTTFAFLPADIVSQILNFGSPAPIDLQIAGPNAAANRVYANALLRRIRGVRGLADIRIQQPEGAPELRVDVDRSRIAQLGLSERDVTNSMVTSLAGSSQGQPTFWLNPKNGVSYGIVAQTPEYRIPSIAGLENLPINNGAGGGGVQVLGGLGTITRGSTPAVVSHYDAQPVIDIYATTQGRDLGSVTRDIQKILKDAAKDRPKGATVNLRGQMVTMNAAFTGLFLGLVAAIVLIYLLIVVNFQSWLDPFVIVTALPAALAGIVWILFATGTTLSVPALTGAIMCMGVATANSILVVSFARERLAATGDALLAAKEAGFTRFRPVVMTALAMIIGMAPMALGLGEGGEQNAPLGRAVIGGLIFATIATLMFVPVVFSLAHGRRAHAARPRRSPESPMPDPASAISTRRLKLAGGLAAAVAALVVVGGLVTRVSADQSQAAWTREQAIPTVSLARIDGGGERHLVLPGDVQAFNTAPIHARVSGYLKRWYVDIGTPVKAGQTLADIDTPDLDQQVAQARADLATAQANQGLAATTAKRWQGLLAADAVSKQEAEEKSGDLAAKSSLVNAARANLNRLLALESFKRITAPFAGVVTTRSTDIGALISTGGPTDAALFTVADQRRLRVYVHVPQNYSALVHPGLAADLTVPEYPGQSFRAVVVTGAQAVAAASGAELVELQLDNADGRLKSGEYAQVTFRLSSPSGATRLPATAIQYRHNGPVVAVVGPDNHVRIHPVSITRDLGSSVEVGAGLSPGDRIADNPPESLADGDLVRVAGASVRKAGA